MPGELGTLAGIVVVPAPSSLLIARLLTPVMGAYFLKPVAHTEHQPRWMGAYLRLVQWGLSHRKLAIVSGVLLVGASVAIAPLLESTFIPASDRGQTTINFELPPDITVVSNEYGVKGGAWLWRKRE